MSITELRGALDTFEEASCCSGKHRLGERLALALPDGDVGAIDDPNFVEWLLAHAEPAPYGHGTVTKIDPEVRSAQRLTARGNVLVRPFDPAVILDEIEAVLSPTVKLSAQLTDVIVYKKGDKFTRHKDTPRSPDLVGTLIVGLPIAHAGGTFVVDDGHGTREFDWGKPAADTLPWVALFSDVDHEIKPVKSGTRVTLVYALRRSDQPRTDARATQRQDMVRRAASALSKQAKWPVMIACGRQVIAEPDAKQPQGIDTLRGVDRDIAEGLVAAGFRVAVRACIAAIANYNEPARWPDTQNLWSITRLDAVPPPDILEGMTDEIAAGEIEEYVLDSIPMEQWAVRKSAAATLIHENACWAEDGMAFGNEGYDALLYTLAALEVNKPAGKATASAKPKATVKAKPEAKAKPKATAKRKTTVKAKPKAKAKRAGAKKR